MRCLVIAGLLVACGHPPTKVPSDPDRPPADGKLPSGPPLVTPGERMQYRVSLMGIELAAYSLAVGDLVDLDGKKTITVQSHAQLVGLATWFAGKVDDKFTSWLDVETGRSRRFQVDEYGSRTTDIEHTVVDLANRKDSTIPVEFHMNDQAPTPEPQKAALPETWDWQSFLVAMRSWEGPPGSKQVMEVFRSRNLWTVTITIKGKTRLKTELGELPALRFDAHVVKLDRDGSKFKDTDERDFSLWVSDEAGRVPLRIDARTDYGDVKMEIVEYSAGNGEPLRK